MKACKGGNPFILKELDALIPDEAFTDLGKGNISFNSFLIHLSSLQVIYYHRFYLLSTPKLKIFLFI